MPMPGCMLLIPSLSIFSRHGLLFAHSLFVYSLSELTGQRVTTNITVTIPSWQV